MSDETSSLIVGGALLGLLFSALAGAFWVGTTSERMAKEGYTAYNLKGTSEIFWKKGSDNTFPQNEWSKNAPKDY